MESKQIDKNNSLHKTSEDTEIFDATRYTLERTTIDGIY